MKERILMLVDEVVARGPFAPDWESLAAYKVPAWYKDVSVLGSSTRPVIRRNGLGLRIESPDLGRGDGPVVIKVVQG